MNTSKNLNKTKPKMAKKNKIINKLTTTKVVSAPVARGRIAITGKPEIQMSGGKTIVRNREYWTDVTTSVSFSNKAEFISPTNSTVFPWLSSVAANYEMYKFKKLKFIYESFCSTSTSGSVIMAIDYDSADTQPANKQQLLAYEGAVRTVPWSEATCTATRQKEVNKERYVNPGTTVVANTDNRLFYLGFINLALVNCGTTGVGVGEVHVEYEIELMVPQLQFAQAALSSGAAVANAGATAALPLGTTVTNSGIVVVDNNGTNNTISVTKPGTYLLDLVAVGASAMGAAAASVLGNATISILNNNNSATKTDASIYADIRNILTDKVVLSLAAGTGISSSILRVSPYKLWV